MESSDYSSDTDSSTSKKPHKCTEKGCKAAFSRKERLLRHTRKHKGERPFICSEVGCGKTYTNNSHLRRHQKTNHSNAEKKTESVLCDHEGCGLVFANKYSLKKHQNCKHNLANYEFVCTECSQGFHRKRQLQQHSYLHTGEAPFRCNDCEMGFTTNHLLNKHKRSHRTYKCDCGETFGKWSKIQAHKKLCIQKRFQCKICDKQFSHLGNFKNHQLTHKEKSDRMMYECPYTDCMRFYFFKRNLQYHVDNFHKKINENKSFNCTYPKCKVVLKTKQSLRMHLQRHFKWVKKKTRNPRRDKGIPKKPMAAVLTGEKVSKKETNEPETVNAMENNLICISERVSDEILLKQCDLTLSLLNEKIVTAN